MSKEEALSGEGDWKAKKASGNGSSGAKRSAMPKDDTKPGSWSEEERAAWVHHKTQALYLFQPHPARRLAHNL